ncbi:hypothetical protein E2C01_081971 [Portunus trituberculatus]|uniref:TFIIS central domain-containing protein n=1 Tax=Portunus trituberculatus TaxID=210409 RepID=A0A5B7IR59_PORTR|nr:hypothetical protein [Portunus trituberculatus]
MSEEDVEEEEEEEEKEEKEEEEEEEEVLKEEVVEKEDGFKSRALNNPPSAPQPDSPAQPKNKPYYQL